MSRQPQPRSPQVGAQADRRDATAPRRRYEALVEVGTNTMGGFEAEAVDVSLDGIRLRTAYMPAPGERLICRFDGYGGEIVAEGEVMWTDREGRGGELGVRFMGLNRNGLHLLEDLCGGDEPEELEEPSQTSAAPPGTRVRLHIQGLGSPMRARVRDTASGEVLVGSNLEFLRVGRKLELEDVERGRTRHAVIEHVGVEIDPETQVPQLVVAMTYGEIDEDDDLTTAPIRVRRARHESTPGPTVIHKDEQTPRMGRAEPELDDELSEAPSRMAQIPETPAPAVIRTRRAVEPAGSRRTKRKPEPELREPEPRESYASAEPPEVLEEQDEEALAEASEGEASEGFAKAAAAFADRLKPHLAAAGHGAKSAFDKVIAAAQKKRRERKERGTPGSKRTTAPPPTGALRSDGKRTFRQQHKPRQATQADEPAPPPAKKNDKRRALVSAALGALAVLAIYLVSSQMKGEAEVQADPAALATSGANAAAGDAAGAPQGELPPGLPQPGGDGVATANVPLYGATPLSTTEPVPVPPAPGDAAAKPAEPDAEPAAPAYDLKREWGVGEVKNPTVLRLKMDGTIDGIVGKETKTGFTIVVPGRKSISSAAGLARRDDRLDSVNVVNYPDRAEIALRFKGEVPGFVTRAKGKRIIIEIATKGKKKK